MAPTLVSKLKLTPGSSKASPPPSKEPTKKDEKQATSNVGDALKIDGNDAYYAVALTEIVLLCVCGTFL